MFGLLEVLVDGAGDAAFQARTACRGLALGAAPLVVGLAWAGQAQLVMVMRCKGGIQLAVATAWQPMAFGAAGADRDRGHSVVHGKQASERNRATPAVSARPDWADKADHIVRERITAVDPGYNGYGCTSGSDDPTIAGALKRLELPDRLLVVRSASDFKDSGPEPAPEPCMTCLHSPGAFGGHSIYRETPAASHGSSHTL